MHSRIARTLILAASAVLLAFGAYALGSQSGNGNASAHGARFFGYGPPPGGPPAGRGFGFGRFDEAARLAQQLHLDVAKVRAALQAARQKADDTFLTELSSQLGVDRAQLESALHPELAAAAKALGVSVPALHDALETVRASHPATPDAFAQALAKALNIDVQKVKDAMASLRPRRFHHP
jgi:hypothetical protein